MGHLLNRGASPPLLSPAPETTDPGGHVQSRKKTVSQLMSQKNYSGKQKRRAGLEETLEVI